MTYDALSRKTNISDPDMGSWSYDYNAAGNLISQTDAKTPANQITFTYDELGRVTRKYYPMGSGDWVDNQLSTSHAPGVYDLMELRASVDVDRLAASLAAYSWSNPAIIAGKDTTVRAVHMTEMRTAIQDLWTAASIGSVPEFSAGAILAGSRTISLRDPDDLRKWLTFGTTNYESSSWAGQNGRKARALYRYDNYSDGQSRGYPVGRRTEMWDVSGRTRWTYDARGRITTEERWIDGQLYTTDWTYDSMDRVVTMTYPDSGTREVVNYTYNSQLLLSSLAIQGGPTLAGSLTYNALDLPNDMQLPASVTDLYLKYRYYGLDYGTIPYGALWDIRLQKTGGDLLRLEHFYDNVRNVTRIKEHTGSDDFAYEYDNLDRLTTRKIYLGAEVETIVYDGEPGRDDGKIGNIVRKNNALYGYHTTKKHAVVSIDGVPTYEYDANGNMTKKGSVYLKYDAENRPVKVSTDLGGTQYVARFAYDGDGKRVKRVDNYGTIHYIGPHYERNVGTGTDTTEVITKFYYGQLGPYRRLIALKKGTTLYYIVPDHLGGTVRTVDTQGNLVDDIRYHAFGATRAGGTNTPTDKRFTGQTLDQSSGLYYYGARYYDAALGRFVQPDTIVPDYKNPQSLNRYSYTLNNPLRYTDPTGHDPDDENEPDREPGVGDGPGDWFGEDWLKQFRAAHNGTDPTIEDYVYRFMTMAQATSGGRLPATPAGFDINFNLNFSRLSGSRGLGQGHAQALSILLFAYLVAPNGAWDIKYQYGSKYEDYGNFHYGAVGAAWGFNEDTLLQAAGIAQFVDDTLANLKTTIQNIFLPEEKRRPFRPPKEGIPGLVAPYGDDRRDQQMIRRGYAYYWR